MATLTELYNLKNSSSLRNRVAVALAAAAEDVRNEAAALFALSLAHLLLDGML